MLQSLVEAESTFHSLLRNGIETYVDPLESVVSSTIHSMLFYNLREVAINRPRETRLNHVSKYIAL